VLLMRTPALTLSLALPLALLLVLSLAGCSTTPEETALRVNGSTTVNPVVARAAELLRAEDGMRILVDTQGGSSGGISALGDGRVEVAMSSRPLNDSDHRKYPQTRFRPVTVGYDAVALVVSRDVWEGGVRSLSRDQVRRIYEGEIHDWREVGGPELPIAFFSKEPGRGTWEVFANWLYGAADEAPRVDLPEVGSNREARSKVASTRGAMTQLSAAWADGETTFALAVKTEDGRTVTPTAEHIADGSYPMSRPLLVITDGEPSPEAQRLFDLLLSPRGQELVGEAGYLPLEQRAEGTRETGGTPAP
jgi:phosphate transport system substrate-binding protein